MLEKSRLNILDESIAESWRSSTLDALLAFVRLKSKSPAFDPNWEEHGVLKAALEAAAHFGRERFPEGVFEILEAPGRTPCLFFDIAGTDSENDSSALFYGHLDKQPEATGWAPGRSPFIPSIENGRLYGRGAADDGYSVYSALTALAALDEAKVPRPRAYGIIETCEETGHEDLSFWLDQLKERCKKVRLLTVLDSSAGDYERLWMTTSFRGLVAATLRVSVLKNGVHSGNASGIVPDSFMIARSLLDRIEDSSTGKVLPEAFYAPVPPDRLAQLAKTAEILGDQYKTEFPWATHPACARAEDELELLKLKCWMPQLAVIGAEGLPSIQDAGNVLRPGTALRLSFRTPPAVNALAASEALRTALTVNPPFGARVELTDVLGVSGWDAKPEKDWFRNAADSVSREIFGKGAAYMADGASIPIMNRFEELFPQAQFFITGVLGPEANAHGPNEMLHLAYVEKLTRAVARIVAQVPRE
ncbi:MAG: M20/M25/M40 family metallo-hydrolase [Duodenibacillus sp.]|nr:M20/M25/M40 family metallo-hydrolase [Duodenibacillus sp.]